MTQERQVSLPLSKAQRLLEVLDQLESRLRHGGGDYDHDYEPSLGDLERAQQLEALRQDLELAIVRSPR